MQLNNSVPYILVLMKCLLVVVSIVFLVSGLDDFFIDICFVLRSLFRRFFILPKYKPMTEEQILRPDEQPIAVMIPAWDESVVIKAMLENTIKTLNYSNYYIFVGTYPNDIETQLEVEKVRRKNDRVQFIVCPDEGPTNKADCLNWVYHSIRKFEKEQNINFAIFVMQDCEDVIHPLCYKLFNYLIPRNDMVQLPVFSFVTKWNNFTAGHYIDEFAQGHYKDIRVREFLDKSFPAAGTGCAFSRHGLDIVTKNNKNQTFSINTLTEDYDIGFRMKEAKLKQIFVKFPTTRTVTKRSFWTKKTQQVTVRDYICVREYFPATFWAAVRQKSRWVVGISLQGWASLKWHGGLSTKYMLFRDRKALITNIINVIGYLIVLTLVAMWISIWIDPNSYRYPPLLEQGSWLWYVIFANAFFLMVRIFLRAYCTLKIYDWKQAFLSFPRMIWGNVINFLATTRAIELYARYLWQGKLITWDKTVHSYPSETELSQL
ncbi:MAG: glycosyl transferase family protein [bacterium]